MMKVLGYSQVVSRFHGCESRQFGNKLLSLEHLILRSRQDRRWRAQKVERLPRWRKMEMAGVGKFVAHLRAKSSLTAIVLLTTTV
jgi:hypothetical protein